MDITIKDVPEGAEEQVKVLAMIAIERHLAKPLQPSQEAVLAFQTDLDAILKSNNMPEKFTEEEAK